MDLRNQVKNFLDITQMPKTNFCKGAGISLTTLGNILSDADVGENTINSARFFMSKTLQKLLEISK